MRLSLTCTCAVTLLVAFVQAHAQDAAMSIEAAQRTVRALTVLDPVNDAVLTLRVYKPESKEIEFRHMVLVRGARFDRDALELGFSTRSGQALWARVPYQGLPQPLTRREHSLTSGRGIDLIQVTPVSALVINGPSEKRHQRSLALQRALEALRGAAAPSSGQAEDPAFQAVVSEYRKAVVKPDIPEDVRRYKVQAEFAVQQRRYADAAQAYAAGLQLAPWWPEGHHNRGILLGELQQYDEAILEMKRFLLLEPKAPASRAAQDRIYQWEGASRTAGPVDITEQLILAKGVAGTGGPPGNWSSTEEIAQ